MSIGHPTALELKLGSALIHMMEHHQTGEPMDLEALRGVLSDPEVRDFIRFAKPLLPLPRQPIPLLRNCYENSEPKNDS